MNYRPLAATLMLCLVSTVAATGNAQLVTVPSESNISVLCMDATTGMVLYEQNADIKRPPASMLKLMMLLLVSEGLDAGMLRLDQPISVSAKASAIGGTAVSLKAGDVFPLNKMMEACAVASANNAAMAVAETVWGSEAGYLKAMNNRARELGMLDTVFRSVHGLPPADNISFDQTTARDMAKLARRCTQHPRIMQWVGQKTIQFRPTDAPRESTNKLLTRMRDCDGLKTGFIRAAGFCIAATAQRNGLRLITIVMGCPSKYGRFDLAHQMLEQGFNDLRRVRVVTGGQSSIDPVPVVNCDTPELGLVATDDVWVTIRQQDKSRLEYTAVFPDPLEPPLRKQAVVGELRVRLDGEVLGSSPLTVPMDLNPKGWRLKLSNGVARWEHLDLASAVN